MRRGNGRPKPKNEANYQGVYIIPIMGPTGAGKSSFINQLLESNVVEVGKSFVSCTKDLEEVEIPASKVAAHLPLWGSQPDPAAPNSAKRLIIVDTPGFDDTSADDSEILARVADWLKEKYGSGARLSGIIYLQDISAARYTGATKRNFEVFTKLCGDDACKSVILGTTKWGKEDHEQSCTKEGELRNGFWGNMTKKGSTIFRVDDATTNASAWDLVEAVLRKGESPILLIQKELLDLDKTLPQTEAAQVLRQRIQELITSLKNTGATPKELKELQQEVAALKEKSIFSRFFGRFFR